MRKTISFTDEYTRDYEYLCEQDNPSLYIRQLIRKDRLKEGNDLESRIEKLIKKLEDSNLTIYSSEPNENSELKKNALKNIINFN